MQQGVERKTARTRNVDQVLHALADVLRRVLDRDEDDAVPQLLHQLSRKDAVEVAPDGCDREDDARVVGLADARGEVADVLRRPLDRLFQLRRLTAPRVRPHLRVERKVDEVWCRRREERDGLDVGRKLGREDVVERILVRVGDPVGVVGRDGVRRAESRLGRLAVRTESPPADARRLRHEVVDLPHVGHRDRRLVVQVDVLIVLFFHEFPGAREGELSGREKRRGKGRAEDEQEEPVPSPQQGLLAAVGVRLKELADVFWRNLEDDGRQDDGEATDDGGDGKLEVEEDDGKEEREDDRDGERKPLGDVVGVLDRDGNAETADRLQEDDRPRERREAVEKATPGSDDGVVPVFERVEHALEVERKAADGMDVDVVGLEEDDEEADYSAEEAQLDVAHPEAGGLHCWRCDEERLFDGWHDGFPLEDELEVGRGKGARETRDEHCRHARDVVHRLGARHRLVSVAVLCAGLNRSELHRRDSEAEGDERDPLQGAETTAEHEDGADRRDERFELEGDLEDGYGEVAGGDVAVGPVRQLRPLANQPAKDSHQVVLNSKQDRRHGHLPPVSAEDVFEEHPRDAQPPSPHPHLRVVQQPHDLWIRLVADALHRDLLQLLCDDARDGLGRPLKVGKAGALGKLGRVGRERTIVEGDGERGRASDRRATAEVAARANEGFADAVPPRCVVRVVSPELLLVLRLVLDVQLGRREGMPGSEESRPFFHRVAQGEEEREDELAELCRSRVSSVNLGLFE